MPPVVSSPEKLSPRLGLVDTTTTDSLLKLFPYGTYAGTYPRHLWGTSYVTEYESMVYRLRLAEEEAVRWRVLAQQLQQDGASLVKKEGEAQLAFQMTKTDFQKQSEVLKTTDQQLVAMREDLRKHMDASQRTQESLTAEVAKLKVELTASKAENERLKLQFEASQGTSKQRGELLTYRDKEVQQLRVELQTSSEQGTIMRNEISVLKTDIDRLKAALASEVSTSNQRVELLTLRTAEVGTLKSELDTTQTYARKVEAEKQVADRNLVLTSEVLNARNSEYAKMQLDLTEAQRAELAQRSKLARLEKDQVLWSTAYLDTLRTPVGLAALDPYYSYSLSNPRSRLLEAQAKAALLSGKPLVP
jgi:chromosome segregation ATPase